jgi:hypothetical protein
MREREREREREERRERERESVHLKSTEIYTTSGGAFIPHLNRHVLSSG